MFFNRFVAVYYAATVFPSDDIPSRYLLLLASGDTTQEVSSEAIKALYGTTHKKERGKHSLKKISLTTFTKLVRHLHLKAEAKVSRCNPGNKDSASKVSPYNNAAYTEVKQFTNINHLILRLRN